MTTQPQPLFKDVLFKGPFDALQSDIHQNAINHGWWEGGRNDGELIALIHSELSECLEALRHGNPESEKIPGFCHAVEELADAQIRIMDMAEARGWDLSGAILAKHSHNAGRRFKHGNKLF
jgi:hypothetical protein